MLSQCPSCAKQIDVPEAVLGKKVRCSGCQAVFVAQAASAAPPAKKKGTEAPAPAPKKAAEPEEFDQLEEVVEEAPAPKKKTSPPPKKKSAPASGDADNPFSFEGDAASHAGEAPAPALDFGPKKEKLGVGPRYRLETAALWMMAAAGFDALFGLAMIGGGAYVFFAQDDYIPLASACCSSLVVFLFALVIVIGARSFSGLRSRGMGIMAAVFTVLSLGWSLLGIGGAVVALLARFQPTLVLVILLCLIHLAVCAWASLKAMLVMFRADIIAAFAEKQEAEAKK